MILPTTCSCIKVSHVSNVLLGRKAVGHGPISVQCNLTISLLFNMVQTVRVLRHQWEYSCEKAKLDLDYNPRGLKEGLAEMLHWLKNLGLIKF